MLWLRIECDEDGWNLQVNDEPKYSTFVHLFSPDLLQSLTVQGKIDVSYVGFGSKGEYSNQNVWPLILICLILARPDGGAPSRVQPDLHLSGGPGVQQRLVCHALRHDDMSGGSGRNDQWYDRTFVVIEHHFLMNLLLYYVQLVGGRIVWRAKLGRPAVCLA